MFKLIFERIEATLSENKVLSYIEESIKGKNASDPKTVEELLYGNNSQTVKDYLDGLEQ